MKNNFTSKLVKSNKIKIYNNQNLKILMNTDVVLEKENVRNNNQIFIKNDKIRTKAKLESN